MRNLDKTQKTFMSMLREKNKIILMQIKARNFCWSSFQITRYRITQRDENRDMNNYLQSKHLPLNLRTMSWVLWSRGAVKYAGRLRNRNKVVNISNFYYWNSFRRNPWKYITPDYWATFTAHLRLRQVIEKTFLLLFCEHIIMLPFACTSSHKCV